MIIASFDIGIKNMALCVFEIEEQCSLPKIVYWEVLNLVHEKQQNTEELLLFPCSCKNKSNKMCTKKTIYIDPKTNLYVCKVHSESMCLPSRVINPTNLRKMDSDALKELCRTYQLQEKSTKGAMVDQLTEYYKEHALISIEPPKIKAGNIDLITLGRNMMILLDDIEILKKVSHILIENQISPIANKMKTLQGMLTQYFIMSHRGRDPPIKIEHISSANKLKKFVDKNECSENNYKKHKKDGIYYAGKIMEKYDDYVHWKTIMEKSQKKDDLADCFLQGWWYIYEKIIK